MITPVPPLDEALISRVADLADTIWREHYTPIIGAAQVEYMLAAFQSEHAIREQIERGYEYYLASIQNADCGYLAVVPAPAEACLMISKIYVRRGSRGRGLGGRLLAVAEDICRERGLRTMWLTVNKYNNGSISWYQKNGFQTTDSIVQDIGEGFVMDDYVMVKQVPPAKPPGQ